MIVIWEAKSMRIDFNEEDPLLIDQISIGVFRVTPWEYSKCGIFRFLTGKLQIHTPKP